MTDLELYREIGKWLDRYHRRGWYRTGLLKDFHHDLWLILLTHNNVTLPFIKQYCYRYPLNAIRYKYYKKHKDFSSREIVLLDNDGEVVTDFADNSFNPEYEFPVPKPKRGKKPHKDAKGVKVTYRNGTEEEFDSVAICAESVGVNRTSIMRVIGKPPTERFTKRKMSHIRFIQYT